MAWRIWLLAACLVPTLALGRTPHLSSRYADLAYANEESFLIDLWRWRDPKRLNAPGARYQEPFVGKTQLSWTDDVVVISQVAAFQGRAHHLIFFITGTTNKPIYKDRRLLFECKLAGRMSMENAINRCRREVENKR
ncbi:hypothetical protein [Gallaecimonas sp. GXIMD4217]|uniref:hypothetical protein n=1 Tax=Gallaecimonas sp. GXIMD4217 TaxID=3131927 RepID=UPI00311B2105